MVRDTSSRSGCPKLHSTQPWDVYTILTIISPQLRCSGEGRTAFFNNSLHWDRLKLIVNSHLKYWLITYPDCHVCCIQESSRSKRYCWGSKFVRSIWRVQQNTFWLQRGKTALKEHKWPSQQLRQPNPAKVIHGISFTLLAVHCHGVYEVVVLAFSSPETHGGWWKDLEK